MMVRLVDEFLPIRRYTQNMVAPMTSGTGLRYSVHSVRLLRNDSSMPFPGHINYWFWLDRNCRVVSELDEVMA